MVAAAPPGLGGMERFASGRRGSAPAAGTRTVGCTATWRCLGRWIGRLWRVTRRWGHSKRWGETGIEGKFVGFWYGFENDRKKDKKMSPYLLFYLATSLPVYHQTTYSFVFYIIT
uniref:Uncharacterized protein n=1 Tax=Ananas comosus var. bracteatus TaxID=296719 RepID=A0A6V7Q1E0_ANACO|nr:unnamed protein product [Ananas comosus var. bracteatus]